MMKQLRSWGGWLVAIGMTAALAAHARAQQIVPWLAFEAKPSPVARILDPLIVVPNGFVTSSGWTQHMEWHPRTDGPVAWWVIEPADGPQAKPGKQWAVMSLVLPERMPTASGVVLKLRAGEAQNIELLAYKGGDNFFRTKKIGAPLRKRLSAGENRVLFRWSDLKVKDAQQVTAFRIVRHQAGKLGIRAVELVYDHEKEADAAKNRRKAHHQEAIQVMLGWEADRGIDLRPLSGRLKGDELERRSWAAVQLLAMHEQIGVWSRLSAKVDPQVFNPAYDYERRRQALVKKLKDGSDIHGDLSALQSDVDAWIDGLMKRIPVDRRRWSVGEDQRFHRPDGRPYRMFGPHFFRSIYPPNRPALLWRPWDIRYLSGLGFNGLRLQIRWKLLEPRQGRFDQAYLKMLLDIMHEAERYGLGVSIDLHWGYPNWFIKGNPRFKQDPDYTDRKPQAHNPYQWPEALVETWKHLAEVLKDVPNIVAFEVPTNEPNFGIGPRGLKDYPSIVHQWNQWLKEKYGTRDKLNAVWSAAAGHPNRYALKADEDWETDSIEPLGYQEGSISATYAENPRLWDHLRFVAWLQESLTTKIMRAIRLSIPDAVGMMQRSIGKPFDRSPVPLDYHAIITSRGENVLPGTHYGMGGLNARKAVSLTLASYDSEQDMENKEPAFRRQIELGLGVCPFAFHARGGGGMLFSDDEWHLKKEVAYLPRLAHWARTHWPEPSASEKGAVAIIQNTRLSATTGTWVGQLPAMLQSRGVRVGVFEELALLRHPQELADYTAVITPSLYMDADLLAMLNRHFKGKVLLYGRLDRDAFARTADKGLGAALVRDGVFLKRAGVAGLSAAASGGLELSGPWDWRFTGEYAKHPERLPADHNQWKWDTMTVPGYWGEVGLTGTRKYRMGDAWYRKEIQIPKSWKGRSLRLKIGAIDDGDWTFFNGTLIGSLSPDKPNSYRRPRDYAIAESSVRWGQTNVLMIRVRNTFLDGGIWSGPVELVSNRKASLVWTPASGAASGTEPSVSLGPSPTRLQVADLLDDVHVLARLRLEDSSEDVPPALIRQGRWYWWIGTGPWSDDSPAQGKVLDNLLAK